MEKVTHLAELNPDKIKRNPDNPRLVFREDEMNQLMESIHEVGIKVPVSVYSDAGHYVLLDGERRWRCAKRLNLEVVPAIVQPKPSRLENILMMFNIHNVRVDWDPMPMARKLGEVRDMLVKAGKETSPKALAAVTGLKVSTVRRALELLELPAKYQKMLLREAAKPRDQQKIKVDVFMEVYKSLHVVEKYTPEVFAEVTKDKYVDSMVNKYLDGVVDNMVSYREVSKIARAELAGINKTEAVPTIIKLVKNKEYSINEAFRDTVESAYEQRNLGSKIQALTEKLTEFSSGRRLSKEVRDGLEKLNAEIARLLDIR